MAANSPSIILLDLENEYQQFDAMFRLETFHRFTDRDQCLQHISSRPANNRTLHFFLPNSEHTIINPNFRSANVWYYIYCMNSYNIQQMSQHYCDFMFFKIFNANALLPNLQAANLVHSFDHANRSQHEPDEHDMALLSTIEMSEALAKELHQYLMYQSGVQPED